MLQDTEGAQPTYTMTYGSRVPCECMQFSLVFNDDDLCELLFVNGLISDFRTTR